MSADRVPPRRRQALPGQPDARPRGGQGPAGVRHQLHRVQLPDPAGQRLLRAEPPATAARCSSAAPTSGATSPPGSTTSAGAGAGPVHAFVTPLVTKADGTKFGKTEGGAVWLDPDDDQPVRLLPVLGQRRRRGRRRATCGTSASAPARRSRSWRRPTAERPAARAAQRALAEELTTLVHGEAESAQADRRQPGAVRPGFAGRPGPGDAARPR